MSSAAGSALRAVHLALDHDVHDHNGRNRNVDRVDVGALDQPVMGIEDDMSLFEEIASEEYSRQVSTESTKSSRSTRSTRSESKMMQIQDRYTDGEIRNMKRMSLVGQHRHSKYEGLRRATDPESCVQPIRSGGYISTFSHKDASPIKEMDLFIEIQVKQKTSRGATQSSFTTPCMISQSACSPLTTPPNDAQSGTNDQDSAIQQKAFSSGDDASMPALKNSLVTPITNPGYAPILPKGAKTNRPVRRNLLGR